jgi:hypothetical protein
MNLFVYYDWGNLTMAHSLTSRDTIFSSLQKNLNLLHDIVRVLGEIPIYLIDEDFIYKLSRLLLHENSKNVFVTLRNVNTRELFFRNDVDDDLLRRCAGCLEELIGHQAIQNIVFKPPPSTIDDPLAFADTIQSYHMDMGDLQHFMASDTRDWFRATFGYNILSRHLLKQISEFIGNNSCLSIMAGKGVLEYCLQLMGKKMTITNYGRESAEKPISWKIEPYCSEIDIKNMDWKEAIRTYDTSRVLLASWIPYHMDVTDLFELFKGEKLVLLGETEICATPEFWKLLHQKFDAEYVGIQNHFGIYNCVYLCTKKEMNVQEKPVRNLAAAPTKEIKEEWITVGKRNRRVK